MTAGTQRCPARDERSASALLLASLKGDLPILSRGEWFKENSRGKSWEKIWQINKKAMMHGFFWENSMRFNAFYLFLASNIELCSKFYPSRLRRKPKIMACDEQLCPLQKSNNRFFDLEAPGSRPPGPPSKELYSRWQRTRGSKHADWAWVDWVSAMTRGAKAPCRKLSLNIIIYIYVYTYMYIYIHIMNHCTYTYIMICVDICLQLYIYM